MEPTTVESSPEWSSRTKRTFALLMLAFFILLVWAVRDILPLVVVSVLAAFIFHPPVTFLARTIFRAQQNQGIRRTFAILVVFALAILILIVLVLVVVPPVLGQLQDFLSDIPALLERLERDTTEILAQPITWNGEPILLNGEQIVPLDRIEEATGTRNLSQLLPLDTLNVEEALNTFLGSARSLTGPAFSFVGGAFNTLINITFLIMMTFYLTKDGANFVHVIVDLAPQEYQSDVERLVNELAEVWHGYLRGQLLLCFVIGIAVYFAAMLLGLPNPEILGLIAGLLEFIPNLGPLLALIPAAFLALVSTSITLPFLSGLLFMLIVIIVWTLIQQIEAVFLVPRIMGDSLDLHPLVVLIAVLGGAAIGGALGVILAAPFVASARVLLRYVYGKVTGRDPFLEIADKRTEDTPSPEDDSPGLLKRASRMLGLSQLQDSSPVPSEPEASPQE
ncbi:MAG: AI-2E family transporter [Anaerolineae bacterium]|nr:AI-2E family transporter [Anaerolineae bacterium]